MNSPHMRAQPSMQLRGPSGADMPRVLTDAEVYAMVQEAAKNWERPGWFVPERPSARREKVA